MLAYAQNDATAMEKSLILISHEPIRVSTVKSVYGLDAVIAAPSYTSALTNKEATFAKFPYELSATASVGPCLSGVLRPFAPLLHRFILFCTARTVLLYSNQGPIIDSDRLEHE